MKASILTIGDEILIGQIVDTIRKYLRLFVLRNFSYVFCHRFVG